MDDQQAQRQINEAAEKFADAIKESYRLSPSEGSRRRNSMRSSPRTSSTA
jgi:hypothetical protein